MSGISGANDLYLGTKIALTEQKGVLPETGVILQMTVPTGADEFTSSRVMPGINFAATWELTDRLTMAGNLIANRAVDETGHHFTDYAQSFYHGQRDHR